MTKLVRRPNKRQVARETATDILKDYDYVLNPRDNTYQLVHRETGELYSGALGGLEADKGLLQSDRRMKRLVGEQLSHQRHLQPRQAPTVITPETKVQEKPTETKQPQEQKPKEKTPEEIAIEEEKIRQSIPEDEKLTDQEYFEMLDRMREMQVSVNTMQPLRLEKKPLVTHMLPGFKEKSFLDYKKAPSVGFKMDSRLTPKKEEPKPNTSPDAKVLEAIGISDDVYYPSEEMRRMTNKNTAFLSQGLPQGSNYLSWKDRGYDYIVSENPKTGKQEYIDLTSWKTLGTEPDRKEMPSDYRFNKRGMNFKDWVITHPGKERVEDKYWKIPEMSDKYAKQINRAIQSGDKYIVAGDKLYNIADLLAKGINLGDISTLSKYGVDLPRGVNFSNAGGYRKALSYYKGDGGTISFKCGGKARVSKKQSGGEFQISKLNPDDLSEQERYELWKKQGNKAFPELATDPKTKEFQFEKPVEGTELKGTNKSGITWNPNGKVAGQGDTKAAPGKEYIDLGNTTFDADTRTLLEKGLNFANPLLGVADFLVQRRALNKLGSEKIPRTYETAPQVGIQAVQDIPHEVLVARENEINRMRSQYKGSDPVMELVSKHMVEVEKDKAREKLSSDRAAFVADERRRVAGEKQQNQLRVAETDAKNRELTRQYDAADYQKKMELIERKADLTGQALGLVAKGIENRVTTKTMADLKSKELEMKSIDQNISLIEAKLTGLDPDDPAELNEIKKLQSSLDALVKQRNAILGEAQSTYTTMGKDALFGMKNGGKLLPKK